MISTAADPSIANQPRRGRSPGRPLAGPWCDSAAGRLLVGLGCPQASLWGSQAVLEHVSQPGKKLVPVDERELGCELGHHVTRDGRMVSSTQTRALQD